MGKTNQETDLTIIYRVSPIQNPNKTRPNNLDKMGVINTCLDSILGAFNGEKVDYIVLVDKPSYELVEALHGKLPKARIETCHFDTWDSGNVGTFHKQLDIATSVNGKVLFLEDDYFFLPKTGRSIIEALDKFEFISIYDHPLYYVEEKHKYKKDTAIAGGRHWQTVTSTTLTFATHCDVVRLWADFMKKFGWADSVMWEEMAETVKLWSPIPTIATHMEEGYLSPNIKWTFQ